MIIYTCVPWNQIDNFIFGEASGEVFLCLNVVSGCPRTQIKRRENEARFCIQGAQKTPFSAVSIMATTLAPGEDLKWQKPPLTNCPPLIYTGKFRPSLRLRHFPAVGNKPPFGVVLWKTKAKRFYIFSTFLTGLSLFQGYYWFFKVISGIFSPNAQRLN